MSDERNTGAASEDALATAPDPNLVDERGSYRGIDYVLQGRYADAERKAGTFVWWCRYGVGVTGDYDTARKLYLERIIDENLALERA